MVAYVFISIKAYMIYPHSLVRKIELEIHQKKKKKKIELERLIRLNGNR